MIVIYPDKMYIEKYDWRVEAFCPNCQKETTFNLWGHRAFTKEEILASIPSPKWDIVCGKCHHVFNGSMLATPLHILAKRFKELEE